MAEDVRKRCREYAQDHHPEVKDMDTEEAVKHLYRDFQISQVKKGPDRGHLIGESDCRNIIRQVLMQHRD